MIGAIDTHCHVFVDADVPITPTVGGAAYDPPRVDVHDHARELDAAGCERGVLVQPSAYGDDHRCLLAALRRRPDHLRGVVCIDLETPEDTLQQMHALGVRGTRLQDGYPGGVPVKRLVEVGERVAALGWHIELWTDVRRHVGWLGEAIRRCPVPVVLDHQGYVSSDAGLDDPGVRLMLDLLTEGQIWIALTGLERLIPGRVSPGDAGFDQAWKTHQAAIADRVRIFVDVRPDRLLWGTDWPHVGLTLPPPNSADVRARLEDWVPDAGLREQILVDNPARRYDFMTH